MGGGWRREQRAATVERLSVLAAVRERLESIQGIAISNLGGEERMGYHTMVVIRIISGSSLFHEKNSWNAGGLTYYDMAAYHCRLFLYLC